MDSALQGRFIHAWLNSNVCKRKLTFFKEKRPRHDPFERYEICDNFNYLEVIDYQIVEAVTSILYLFVKTYDQFQ